MKAKENTTEREKLQSIPFNRLNLRIYDDCIVANVGIMRPRNAPSRKITNADINREKKTQAMNYKMHVDDKRTFQSFSELLDYLIKTK